MKRPVTTRREPPKGPSQRQLRAGGPTEAAEARVIQFFKERTAA